MSRIDRPSELFLKYIIYKLYLSIRFSNKVDGVVYFQSGMVDEAISGISLLYGKNIGTVVKEGILKLFC